MESVSAEDMSKTLLELRPDAPKATCEALSQHAGIESDLGEAPDASANFFMLLLRLHELENNPKATIEELEQANAAVRAKADAIKIRLTMLEAEEKRLAQLQQEFGAAKAIVANNKNRLNEWARHCLIYYKREKVHGDKFEMHVIERDGGVTGTESLQVDGRLRMRYPNYVNASYSLNLTEIAKAIKAGATDLPPGLAIGKSHSFQIKVRKGSK